MVQVASLQDCNLVYHRILNIQAQELDPKNNYSQPEKEAAISLLDQHFKETKAKEKFFGYCLSRLSANQTYCMRGANNMFGMSICEVLVK
jgi:hypothetical protein